MRLAKAHQEQHQPQHDPTRTKLEKLPRHVAGHSDGHRVVFQAALADDDRTRSSDVERVLPSIDRPTRPVDLCGAEGFLSRDVVHHTLHRLFILAVRALHLYVAAKTISKAAAFATLSVSGISESAQRRDRRNSQPAPTDSCRKS